MPYQSKSSKCKVLKNCTSDKQVEWFQGKAIDSIERRLCGWLLQIDVKDQHEL